MIGTTRRRNDYHGQAKEKLTAAQRAAKKQCKKDFMTVFMHGKQVRVRRPPTIDGMPVEEFIRQNADPIWLNQNGEYEILHEQSMEQDQEDPVEGSDHFDFIFVADKLEARAE